MLELFLFCIYVFQKTNKQTEREISLLVHPRKVTCHPWPFKAWVLGQPHDLTGEGRGGLKYRRHTSTGSFSFSSLTG